MWQWLVLPAMIAFASAGCDGNGKNGTDSGVDGEEEDDTVSDELEISDEVEPSELDGQDPVDGVDSMEDPTGEDVLADEEEEELIGPGCGDGIVEGAEVCDDGNRRTEFCGRWEDCLGDCSLMQGKCGNGRLDPGEECDDGNSDSMDYCTTSCNINDHGIGSPCECPNCYSFYVNRGPIIGCEGVEVPTGSGGELSCVHTFLEAYTGYKFFSPEGYCTIGALKCIGDEIDCQEVENIGDIDTFECPPGYPYFGVSCQGAGGIGIALKLCLRPCSSPAQCRWNGFDEDENECGRHSCIPHANDPERSVCFDNRNFNMILPDIICEFI
jgi:cysteine-rich repeat protein